MDRIDQKILALLQEDASIANNDLADLVGLAPSSCLRRVRRLKADGIITRTIALTDPKKMGRALKAIVTVRLADHGKTARRDWLAQLDREKAVSQVYSVSGETDVVVMLNLTDMEEFQQLGERMFSDNQNVIQFTTMFVLEQHKFNMALEP
ncbi:Lrp/AsnC family transcriptional regulator [uncultured Tateyamaria sp.]|uniref:Lrp/AsnC family transcriptional regulator n=1 Tax=uncultured Tateyamaria sp. TaxID=455651 RepID=UPI002628B0AE|nr:Lrp/AsnC family transcriptional regulator [uncultured Tateyamaria sp.]